MVKSVPGHAANRARIALTLSQFTVPLLGRIYTAFDGDMVAALVLGEIAHRNVEAWLAQQENPEEVLQTPEQREQVMKPCNALSIAEACKLPRETVRRKVVALIERRLIYRNAKGHLYLCADVADRFGDMPEQILDDLLLTADRLRDLLAARQRMTLPASTA